MREVVITGANRTAIGSFGGTLASIPAVELGTAVVQEAIKRSGIAPDDIDELIMGQVLQSGCGPNTARQMLLKAGIPISVPAYTVNKVCASGLKAITLAASSIASGENDIVVAGGVESMSQVPFLASEARWGYRLGDALLSDGILRDALIDAGLGCHMGITAENLAKEYQISRFEQDAFAVSSQEKAGKAAMDGKFAAEIVSIKVPRKKGDPIVFGADEYPRKDATIKVLSSLKPAFKKDGTVTAGNASGINDGAAAMILLSAEEAKKRGIHPMARIISYASVGVEPARMGMGPVAAITAALAKAHLKITDIDLVELNEAFAAQAIAVIKELHLVPNQVNVNGGAIALGHPVGASGARILVTLLHAMTDRNAGLGLATLCIGGGQGIAIIVERT